MFPVDQNLLVLGLLVLVATASSKLSTRAGIPFLLVFVVLGMLAGSEGIGGIDFTDFSLAHAVGTTALVLILFDGGLRTSLHTVARALGPASVLASLGVVLTAGIVGVAASLWLDLPLEYGLLLGSIVGSTDAAAVFAALRSSSLHVRPRVASTLELESGSNDPMAILLTVGIIAFTQGEMTHPGDWVSFLAQQLVLGGGVGWAMGRLMTIAINRIELQAAGLYPMLTLAAALTTYGAAAVLGGSGMLAAYIAGVVIGNQRIVFQRGIGLFHDGLAWLGQIVMFVVLGLLSFPSQVVEEWGAGLFTAGVLMFVARPVAVILCLLPFRFDWRELVFLSWAGLKGAVPIILATYPFLSGTSGADRVFHLVFFVVLLSVLVQGWTLPLVARVLEVDVPEHPTPPLALEIMSVQKIDADIVGYLVKSDARAANRSISELGLPEGVAIVMVVRDNKLIPPQDQVVVRPGDYAFVMLRPNMRWLADHVFSREGTTALREPIPGRISLRDLAAIHSIPLPGNPDQTLDEFIREQLDGPPQRGTMVRLGMVGLRVLDLDRRGRVREVGVHLVDASQMADAP